MNIPMDALFNVWDVFVLVLIRMSGMFLLSPIFGQRSVPGPFKIGLALILSMIVAPGVTMPEASRFPTLAAFIATAAMELLVGLALGFISYMIFSAIYVAGQLIDMRIGFGMVNVFDPVSNVQVPITANFYVILATLFIFATNTHHLFLLAITDSYQMLPVGGFFLTGDLLDRTIRLFTVLFSLGFRIAAPVTVAILVTDMALGIISKSVPQMNVFMLGMPVKLILGMFILYLTIASFRGMVGLLSEGMLREMKEFLTQAGQAAGSLSGAPSSAVPSAGVAGGGLP